MRSIPLNKEKADEFQKLYPLSLVEKQEIIQQIDNLVALGYTLTIKFNDQEEKAITNRMNKTITVKAINTTTLYPQLKSIESYLDEPEYYENNTEQVEKVFKD